jgi:hypothetical protein
MDGSHEQSDPRVRAEAPGNLADRGSPWAHLRPHSATAKWAASSACWNRALQQPTQVKIQAHSAYQ